MPRPLSAAFISALATKALTLGLFLELVFADNTYYLWSGVGSMQFSGPPANPASTFPYGTNFTGMGWLGKISAIPQTTKVQAQNVTLALSGIPATLVSEVVGQVRLSGTATIWLGLFSAGSLILDPIQVFAGGLDVPSLVDSGETSTISITCENPLLSLNLAPQHTFDDPDQQLRYPGDLGFSFVDALPRLNLFWPQPINWTTAYPVSMTVTPSVVDIAVGGTCTVSVTINYSDGSTFTMPGATGSGPSFHLNLASSNPSIARYSIAASNQVTGVSPGQCAIMARIPFFGGGGSSGASGMYRQICAVIVHS